MKTRKAVLVAPRKFEIHEADVTPGGGQVLIKIEVCGLCNWEQNHWKGLLGKCPQSLGHEWVGKVVELGKGVTSFKVGDTLIGTWGPAFADYIVMPVSACTKISPDIKPTDTLGEPLKCIVTVLHGIQPEIGDIGVIIGCGPMGLWCIQGLAGRTLGALIAIDVVDKKLDLAKKFGATHVINAKTQDPVKAIAEISGGHMADFVIEGTGVPETLTQAVSYLKESRGRIALMSTHSRASTNFDWRPIMDKGITLIGTHPASAANEADDLRRTAILINNGTFKMDGIISHVFPLDKIQEAFETCENKPADYMKGVVIP